MKVAIEGQDKLVRDIQSGAILQTDKHELNEYLMRKKIAKAEREFGLNIDARLTKLENLLQQLIESKQ